MYRQGSALLQRSAIPPSSPTRQLQSNRAATPGVLRSEAACSSLSSRQLSPGGVSSPSLSRLPPRTRSGPLLRPGAPWRRAPLLLTPKSQSSGSPESPRSEQQESSTAEEVSTTESRAAHDEQEKRQSNYGQSSWLSMVLSLPLELAAISARTNDHWLQKRKRKRWWSRKGFPKVPVEEPELPPDTVTIWQKLLPLAMIFFCASFNLTILQNLKDAIMITTAGAETLPWLASFCVLPASVAFFMAYGRMVESLPGKSVFYACVLPLVGCYVFFATLLYPASAYLHPHGMFEYTAHMVPVGLHGLLKVIEHWTFSLFFCVAELWGSVVISVLFWTLANDVCTVADAKTIYPIMGIAANIALVVAGNYMKFINRNFTQGSVLLSLRFLVGTVLAMSIVMMGAKYWIDSRIAIAVNPSDAAVGARRRKVKKKGSFAESFAVFKSSPKIRNLATLVMCYGVSHRLFEFAWKGQLRLLHPSAQAYQGVLADVSIATGIVTIALMITGRFVFQYLGWGVAALATPSVMLLSGVAFFGLSVAASLGSLPLLSGVSVANIAALGATAGALTQVFARSSKFSLFDPAKEMVYIEMSKEEKSKGKAAVDLLGSQIGKSGASWITQALLLALGSISASLPIIGAVFVAVIGCWIRAVNQLGSDIRAQEAAEKAKAEQAAVEAEQVRQQAEAEAEAEASALHAAAEKPPSISSMDELQDDMHHRAGSASRWPGSVTDALEQAGSSMSSSNGSSPPGHWAAGSSSSHQHSGAGPVADDPGTLRRRQGQPDPR